MFQAGLPEEHAHLRCRMNWLRAYPDKIIYRLAVAFGLATLGTLAIWFYSSAYLSRFSTELDEQLTGLLAQSQKAASLEAHIVDQIGAAQRFLGEGRNADDFDRPTGWTCSPRTGARRCAGYTSRRSWSRARDDG